MPPTEATQATKEHPSTFGQVESAREVADRKCEVVEGLVKLKQFQMLCSKWLRWENLGESEFLRRAEAGNCSAEVRRTAWRRLAAAGLTSDWRSF